MKTELESNVLTIFLEGRIDSVNAAKIEDELFAAVNDCPGAQVSIDAEALEYISSAGLRVLMKLQKRLNTSIPVLNVSDPVYDIFDMTGFTNLLDVHRRQ